MRQFGFLYPGLGLDHADIVQAINGADNDVAQVVLAEAHSTPADGIIISSEGLSNLKPSRVREWFSDFHVEIIVYLREQADAFISAYQQDVKGHLESASFAEYAARYLVDYHVFLSRWANVFGRKNLHVRIYDRSELVGGDVVSDFLALLGINDVTGFACNGPDLNPSLAGAPLEAKRRLNYLCDPRSEYKLLEATYAYLMEAAASDPANRGRMPVDEDLVEAIRARHAPSNEAVAIDFLGRDVAFQLKPVAGRAQPIDEARVAEFFDRLQQLAIANGVVYSQRARAEGWRERAKQDASPDAFPAILSEFDAIAAVDHPAEAWWSATQTPRAALRKVLAKSGDELG
ncbi:MAG: hypothetical protein AB7G40_09445 [Hyphomonadaceae bacterium]